MSASADRMLILGMTCVELETDGFCGLRIECLPHDERNANDMD